MKLGFTAYNVGTLATPEFGRLAQLAEELGYESLWTAEHIVLPDSAEGPRPGNMPFLDSIAIMSYLAALTKTIKLATGVLLLPQHEPLLLAKQLASVDVLSNGRLITGFGVGGVEAEAVAMQAPMNQRGARADEYLQAMIAVWTQPHPSFHGKYVNFEGITAYPRPVQQPYPPFVVGGRAEGALRRTVHYAAGWYGFAMTLEQTRQVINDLNAARQKYGRPAELGDVEITIHPREPLTPETIRAYEQLGVQRLLLRLAADRPLADSEQIIRDNAPAKVGV